MENKRDVNPLLFLAYTSLDELEELDHNFSGRALSLPNYLEILWLNPKNQVNKKYFIKFEKKIIKDMPFSTVLYCC